MEATDAVKKYNSSDSIKSVDLQTQYKRLSSTIKKYLDRTFDKADFINGEFVTQLEEELARRAGAAHCVSCASGTDALILALKCLGAAPGDVILCPSFTFAATAEAILWLGCIPEFVDIDKHTFNISPEQLARRLHDRNVPKPKGIIAVDIFGQPAEYEKIKKLLIGTNIWLMADAAQSFGAITKYGRSGTLADITTTSFYPSKPLGCYGDGGAIFTNNNEQANRLRLLRNHGQSSTQYTHEEVGCCSRLDTIQAAVLMAKLSIFDSELEQRNKIANNYHNALTDFIETPQLHPSVLRSSWAQYTVRIPGSEPYQSDQILSRRSKIIARLSQNNIPARVYYSPPLHKQKPYKKYKRGSLEVTNIVSASTFSIPVHSYLDDSVVRNICATLVETLREV